MVIRSTLLALSLTVGGAVNATPAPVTDLSDGNMESRVSTLERMVGQRANMQHRIQQQLDLMQDEVNELRGTLELHNHQLEKILERQRELYLEIDKRMSALQSQPSAPAVSQGPAQAEQTQEQLYALSASESEAYDRAVNLILKDKQYDRAIPEFQSFIQAFPDSSYAPNAHYWLGQLLFNKQDWGKASEQFQVLMSKFPDSPKRADAIFKLGVVEQKRSNLAKAKQLFEQVVSEYPNTSSRKLAENRLRNLN